MKTTSFSLALALASLTPLGGTFAQDTRYQERQLAYSSEQLDNLVAPIALYPDAILAQALVAATFPEQIELAAQFVRSHGTRDIDNQSWDVSVKAVAHYSPVLNMMAQREDWTTALGQAYAEQSSDVMDAVQRLRAMAKAQGNLESTSQQRVVVEDRVIRIEPAQPRVIYVPAYDPAIVYYRPVYFHGSYYASHWSFGIGFPIGAWLSYDCDWRYRRVYYDGWRGGGWRAHSRPFIHINVVYVHPRYEVVHVNRTVIHRHVNYVTLNRYNTVHRTVNYDNRSRGGPGPIDRGQRSEGQRSEGRGGRGGYDGRNDDRRDDDRRGVGSRNDGARDESRRVVTRGEMTVQPRRTVEPARTAQPIRKAQPTRAAEPIRTAEPVRSAQPSRSVEPRRTVEPRRAPSAPMTRAPSREATKAPPSSQRASRGPEMSASSSRARPSAPSAKSNPGRSAPEGKGRTR